MYDTKVRELSSTQALKALIKGETVLYRATNPTTLPWQVLSHNMPIYVLTEWGWEYGQMDDKSEKPTINQ